MTDEQRKGLLILGILACLVVMYYAVVAITTCDAACQARKNAIAQAEYNRLHPPPPPPPPYPNTDSVCTGEVQEATETSRQFRKLPGGGFRSNSAWDGNKNPCAIYFETLEGTIGFGTDSGFRVYSWTVPQGRVPTTAAQIDLVAATPEGPARWKYMFCKQWHPVMKEWRCN